MTERMNDGGTGPADRPPPEHVLTEHSLTGHSLTEHSLHPVYPSQSVEGVPVLAVPRERRAWWRPARTEVRGGVAIMVALAVVGLLVGLVWYWIAPRIEVRITQPGQGIPVGDGNSEQIFAADGWFVTLTLAVGVLAGLGAWLWRTVRGPAILVALTVGGLVGALLTWWVGQKLGHGPSDAALRDIGSVVRTRLDLRATAALVVEPFVAVVIYLVAAGFASHDDLGRVR